MLERIRQLEAAARALEPDADERGRLLAAVAGYADSWLEQLPRLPGYVPDDEASRGALHSSPIGAEPTSLEEVLTVLAGAVVRLGVNESAGHFFGFIPGSGIYAAALGDYLAAVTNRYAGIFDAGPGAVRLEHTVLAWIADFVGYPEGCGGDLTSGGSVANLTAMVTARDAAGLEARHVDGAVVYLTQQTHHSVDKALHIAGLGESVKRLVPLDEGYRMKPDALDDLIRRDRRAGLRPWLIVASAGSTDTGAVDPIDSIADVAQAHDLWLHADGAYGAAFALCDEGKRILAGIDRSDSLILDPHKGLFLPFGTGVVLVRDRLAMRRALAYQAGYLQDVTSLGRRVEVSPADVSPELTRPFRGLRLWLPLKLAGVAAFRAALEEKLLLARYFYERMKTLEGFEVGPYPDLSVVTFRYLPRGRDANDANRELVAALRDDGRVFLSSTTIDGKVTLRLAVLNARTHLAHIDLALEVIPQVAQSVRR